MRGRLIAVLAVTVTASIAALSLVAIVVFGRAVEPELQNRTQLIGSIVRGEIQRALELGIPIDGLVGVDQYLSDTLNKFDEVDRITVATAEGKPVASVERKERISIFQNGALGEVIAMRRTSHMLPVLEGNRLVGGIVIEISPLFIQTRLRDVFLDVMVIGLIATLVALELALAVAMSSVGKPLSRVIRLLDDQQAGDFSRCIRQGGLSGLGRVSARLNDHAEDLTRRFTELPEALRAGITARILEGRPTRLRLSDFNDIRLALFLFSVASEIAAAFLPVYARAASRPDWLAPDLAAAAPLVLYLAAITAMIPFAGRLGRLIGPRRLFIGSVPPTALALAAMAFSHSVVGVSAWRGIMAVFYATAIVACQEYAIRAAENRGSIRPVAASITVVFSGVFCGSALGGLIAGRFGFEAAFLSGSVIALIAGVLGMITMRGTSGDAYASLPRALGGVTRLKLPSIRFLVLLFGVAVPMNAATTIFIWYLTPIVLSASGSGLAEIARVVMLYYLATVLVGPSAAQIADERMPPGSLVVVGALISGCALLSLAFWGGFWAIVVVVVGLGVGHAMMRAPLYAVARRLTAGSESSLALLRFVERFGALIGLTASSIVLANFGAGQSVLVLGVTVLVGGLAFAIVGLPTRVRAVSGPQDNI